MNDIDMTSEAEAADPVTDEALEKMASMQAEGPTIGMTAQCNICPGPTQMRPVCL
jgi:hypothetical protein